MFLLQTWVMTVVVTTPTIVEVEVEVDTLRDLTIDRLNTNPPWLP
jgi:hypothetical protein